MLENECAEEGSGAPRYPVKPYSIVLAVSVEETVFFLGGLRGIFISLPEAGKPYFCGHSFHFKTSMLWH